MKHLTEEELKKAAVLRHDLHMYPELSGKEYNTSQKIRSFLEGLPGFEILSLPAATGVVARIGTVETEINGTPEDKDRATAAVQNMAKDKTGKATPFHEIMLRADIDALPQTEQVEIPWKSRVPGIMHACGHDLHTAALCGAALALSRLWKSGRLDTAVDLVFQPAEEGTTGARSLIDAGLFDIIHPQVCYGLHNWPSVDTGKTVCQEGALMSAKRNFDIIIHGAGGHGSMPHLNIDPVVCAAAVIQSLQTVVSRNVNPLDAAILSVNRIEGGSPVNLVVDQVLMKATVRSLSETVLDRAIERVEAIVENTALAYECSSEIIWRERIPAVWNSPEMLSRARLAASAAGCEVTTAPPSLASEDFALYRKYVPSFYFWVGSRLPGSEVHELHTPLFFADDLALQYAAELFLSCVLTAPVPAGSIPGTQLRPE